MVRSERRSDQRKKACVQVFVSDLGNLFDVKCVVRDVNQRGCKIVSTRLNDLPELIQLIPDGFDKIIHGKIVWRDQNMAGVRFERASSDVVRAAIKALCNSHQKGQQDDILLLERIKEPLGYADRLKKYRPLDK